jgi:dehydrogenase/reductase SDR family protein 12
MTSRPDQRPRGLRGALDRLADASVALSYGAVGYHLRRPDFDALGDLRERTFVVTGANSGVGFAAARALALAGGHVVMVCRNPARGEEALARVRDVATARAPELVLADLSIMADVDRLAGALGQHARIDALLHNAGVLPAHRHTTSEGFELTFATNLLSGFLLTRRLEPTLLASAPARVVHVTSGGMYTQRLNQRLLEGEPSAADPARFDGVVAYAQTKRAQVILSQLWAARWAGRGVVSHAMHPGWADTPGVETSLPRFHALMRPLLRTPEQGADTLVWLAGADDDAITGTSGKLWLDRRPRREHMMAKTHEQAADRQALWERCAALTGGPLDPLA